MPDVNTVQTRQSAAIISLAALPFIILLLYLIPVPVAGQVSDANNGEPLPGQIVRLANGRQLKADANGKLRLWAWRLARPIARVTKNGYLAWEGSPRFSVAPLLPARLDIKLQPTRLKGLVLDAANGRPVAGAQVTAAGLTTTSDDRGRYELLRVPIRPFQIEVQATGFLPFTQILETDRPLDGSVWVNLELLANGLHGVVTDAETGQPLSGVKIRFADRSTRSGQDGSYYLSRLSGPGQLMVTLDGYRPISIAVESENALLGQEAVPIALQPTVLAGQVLDERSGEPLMGVQITVDGQTATTDAAGHYQFKRLSGQDLTVIARLDGYDSAQQPVDEARHLVQGEALNLTLQPHPLSGRVLNQASHTPLPGAQAIAGNRVAVTDDQGRFTLWGVDPPVTVVVSADGFIDAELHYPDRSEQVISLEPRYAVVTVSDLLDGTPLAGMTIMGPRSQSTTDAQGAALLKFIEPGEVFTVTAPGYAAVPVIYDGSDHMTVEVYRNTVAGQVVDASDGQPVQGATVYVYDGSHCQGRDCRGQPPLRIVDADAEGRFVIEELPPNFQLMIKAPGYQLFFPQALEPGDCGLPYCLRAELKPFQARGFYIPFHLLYNRDLVRERLDLIGRSDVLNAVVVDMKSDFGELAWEPRYPIARELGVYQRGVMSAQEFLALCRERGIYAIARFVTFKDDPLAKGRPEWAVRAVSNPDEIWLDGEGLAWVDPYRHEVWEYEIALAKELAELGFDELQFDYFRFSGHTDHSQFIYAQPSTPETRRAAISGFARELTAALKPYGVFVSVDVFGYTIWAGVENEANIGQTLADIAPLLDYLSPMIYPQTFGPGSLAAYPEPVLFPYEVVYDSVRLARERIPLPTRIRPWLQGYPKNYRSQGPAAGYDYGAPEMMIQRWAAEDAGADGWLYWSGGGNFPWEIFGSLPPLEELRAQIEQRQAAAASQQEEQPSSPGG